MHRYKSVQFFLRSRVINKKIYVEMGRYLMVLFDLSLVGGAEHEKILSQVSPRISRLPLRTFAPGKWDRKVYTTVTIAIIPWKILYYFLIFAHDLNLSCQILKL